MEPLGEDVRAELHRFGPEGRALDLADAWPRAVGAEIARNSWPARVQQDGTLVVHVRDAVWGFELTQHAGEIASRLPGSPPLKFVPGPIPDAAPAGSAADSRAPSATLEEAREAAAWTAGITDDGLRQAVARAARASLARVAAAAPDDRPV
jgi:hypothetical protein